MKESNHKSYDDLPLFLNAKWWHRFWECRYPADMS